MEPTDISKLLSLGFRKRTSKRYYLLAPGNSYVVVNEENNKYRLEIDGNRIGVNALSVESIQAIVTMLYD